MRCPVTLPDPVTLQCLDLCLKQVTPPGILGMAEPGLLGGSLGQAGSLTGWGRHRRGCRTGRGAAAPHAPPVWAGTEKGRGDPAAGEGERGSSRVGARGAEGGGELGGGSLARLGGGVPPSPQGSFQRTRSGQAGKGKERKPNPLSLLPSFPLSFPPSLSLPMSLFLSLCLSLPLSL